MRVCLPDNEQHGNTITQPAGVLFFSGALIDLLSAGW